MVPTFCFADHMLNVAAGTTVDGCAYKKWEAQLNMMKVKALGEAYRKGWLHNLMGRITPLTVRDHADYEMMADLFVVDAEEAQEILTKMSRDLSAFATAAGLPFGANLTPPEMEVHVSLYKRIAGCLAQKFGFEAPAPFASTVIDAGVQQEIVFIRSFMRARAA